MEKNKDKSKDLAILKLETTTSINPLSIGDSESLKRGDEVVAIGSPLGLLNTASNGIISGFYQDGEINAIQTTAPISLGSSGGALLNKKGELIGITYSGFNEGQNLGFAIPSNEVKDLYGSIEAPITFQSFYRKIPHEVDLQDFLHNCKAYSSTTLISSG